MPDRKKLSQYLRDLLTAQADVTATPQMPRQEPMTIGPRTGVRDPAPQSGPLAAIARSMAPSEDTPMGMVNEMLNPLRQGASARELAGKAVGAIQRREMGKAAGLGALAAMSVPGVPGDEAAKPFSRTIRTLENAELAFPSIGKQVANPRLVENPAYNEIFDRIMELRRAQMEASAGRSSARKLLREGEEWRDDLQAAGREFAGAKDRSRALEELIAPLREQLRQTERYIPEPPQP